MQTSNLLFLTYTFRNLSTYSENLWTKGHGIQNYDFDGAELKILHKDWIGNHDVISKKCKDDVNGMDCDVVGSIMDWLNQYKSLLNLTYRIDLCDGDWGVTPKNGNWIKAEEFS